MKTKWMALGLGLLAITALSACEKLLDIDRGTDSSTTPVTVEDFEQILNNQGLTAAPFDQLIMLTDDVHLEEALIGPSAPALGREKYTGLYLWQAEPWTNTATDPMYSECYRWIAQLNLVLEYMPTATPAGLNERRALAMAQAKIYRAYFYLQLANIYGAHYQPATAATELAVPLVLKNENNTAKPRATVAQVYQQIVKDLQEALAAPELPDMGIDIIHPGRAAALGLLARCYLYMGNYTEAEKMAAEALKIRNGLLDYRVFLKAGTGSRSKQPRTLLDQRNSPEVLMAGVQILPGGSAIWDYLRASDELLALFVEPTDMRAFASFKNTGSDPYVYLFGTISGKTYLDTGIGVPEMMLTRAECLARANNAPAAIELLNQLRKYRFKEADYRPLPSNVAAESALRIVLDERRRELMFRGGGTRLFDLKRLNLDPRFKKDLQRLGDKGQVLASLPAGSPRHVLPFHPGVIAANPLIVQNPR